MGCSLSPTNTIGFLGRQVLKQLLTEHFFSKKIIFLGHVITPEGIKPFAKRKKGLKNLKSTASKRDVMKIVGFPWFLQLLHQKPPCGQAALQRLD